jgi:hypothetical protein
MGIHKKFMNHPSTKLQIKSNIIMMKVVRARGGGGGGFVVTLIIMVLEFIWYQCNVFKF